MAFLIIGGKGYIGSRIVRRLVGRGDKVVCLEPRTTGGRIGDLIDGVKMVAGDVRRLEDVRKAIEENEVDGIAWMVFFRTAPPTGTPAAPANMIYDEISTMAMGACATFEAARLGGIKRVIFPSSIHAYGPQELHGERSLTEDAPLLSTSVYGATKKLNEVIAHTYNAEAGMSIISLRIAAVYGPGATVGGRGVNLGCTQCAAGKPAIYPYPAEQRVCLCHVDDIAEMCVRLLQADSPSQEVYNTGGRTLSYRQMAEVVRELIPNAQVSFDEGAGPSDLPYLIDDSRFREEFAFQHRTVRDGFLELINITRQEAGLPPLG